MRHLIASLLLVLFCGIAPALAAVKGQEIDYKAGATALKGFLAYDDDIKGPRPGIIVVHEWWGHNDYARERAKKLAALGYVALALDMYGDGKQAHHPDEAGKLSGEIRQNVALGKERFMAAMDLLKKQPQTDPKRIAAIGYCFGGAVVLQMAREGVDLKGVVSFHGMLDTTRPALAGVVKAKVLVGHGAEDPFVSSEQVENFKKEMDAAKVDYQFISYPGAQHSFTNPDADKYGEEFKLPLKYNADADRASWADMQSFLKKIFGP
jgi:dienelactone hydrolase